MKKVFKLKRKQNGFTLLEFAFVVVVIGLIGAGLFNDFLDERTKALVKVESDTIVKIAGQAQEKWANQQDYTGVTETVMKNNNLFPSWMLTGTTVSNKAKGAVTCAAVTLTTTNDGLECTSTNYSKAFCTQLVPKIEQVMRRIQVGTNNLKPTDGVLDMTAVGTYCTASTSLKFVIPK
jgi:prepilin-type N-terminal cleavage/methylation domain-containing protein